MKSNNFFKIFLFIFTLSIICAFLLSLSHTLLKNEKEQSIKVDKCTELLLSAKVLNYDGFFLKEILKCHYEIATFDKKTKSLKISKKPKKATKKEILQIYKKLVFSFLVNSSGDEFGFKELNIDYENYLEKFQSTGFANLEYKLIYRVKSLKNHDIFVIPINGKGLWGKIYGYLTIDNDGYTVIGATWYKQNETAGLGANITNPNWLEKFCQKIIFQESKNGEINLEKAPIGITIIKGNVNNLQKPNFFKKNMVDGISGATFTCKGATQAYRNSLAPYRQFLVKINKEFLKNES